MSKSILIRQNSRINKKVLRVHAKSQWTRRVARNSQWGAVFGGLRAGPPVLKNFAFFCKNNFILGLFWLKNNAFKTWLRNWQCKDD